MDSNPEDLAKELCERIAFPATRSNVVDLIVPVLKTIQTKHRFATLEKSAEYLEERLELCDIMTGSKFRSPYGEHKRAPRFFFEDPEYEQASPEGEAYWVTEKAKRGDWINPQLAEWLVKHGYLQRLPEPAPPCIVGKCLGCGRPRLASSTWGEYCADSCRDAHQGATA